VKNNIMTAQTPRVVYRSFTYSDNHWSIQPLQDSDPIFIAEFQIHESRFVFHLNPTDSRGYRGIVRLTGSDPHSDPHAVLNRPYSPYEKIDLNILLGIVGMVYESLGLIAQMDVLGNNSHTFDAVSQELQIGQVEEPSLLHGHVYGRGDPAYCYVPGVSLRGPMPGSILVLGGGLKVEWQAGEIDSVSKHMTNHLREIVDREGLLLQQYQISLVRLKSERN
jgi:hypothetical protein